MSTEQLNVRCQCKLLPMCITASSLTWAPLVGFGGSGSGLARKKTRDNIIVEQIMLLIASHGTQWSLFVAPEQKCKMFRHSWWMLLLLLYL